jgi:hypothetical protein
MRLASDNTHKTDRLIKILTPMKNLIHTRHRMQTEYKWQRHACTRFYIVVFRLRKLWMKGTALLQMATLCMAMHIAKLVSVTVQHAHSLLIHVSVSASGYHGTPTVLWRGTDVYVATNRRWSISPEASPHTFQSASWYGYCHLYQHLWGP